MMTKEYKTALNTLMNILEQVPGSNQIDTDNDH
jgi:hypothetical protein